MQRDLWNVRLHQSALAPENLTTLPHFSISSAMSFPKSAGEPKSGVPPRSASLAFILGSARAALISLLSLSTISASVALSPYQRGLSKSFTPEGALPSLKRSRLNSSLRRTPAFSPSRFAIRACSRSSGARLVKAASFRARRERFHYGRIGRLTPLGSLTAIPQSG